MNQDIQIEFAPLQGYTDAIYRTAHNQIFGGIDHYYSPFIRKEHGEIRRKDFRDILPENNLGLNLIPQIIFKDADEFDFLVKEIKEIGYNRIDLNLGCPFPMQTKRGRGAAILANPATFASIVESINKHSDISFSLKMRIGMDNPTEFIALMPMINATNFNQITVHPRIAKQQYTGLVNLDSFGELLAMCNHKIVYNGDLNSLDDIKRITTMFPKISGIMIGRGLLSRPSLATEFKLGIELGETEIICKIAQMHNMIYDYYSQTLQGESQLLMKMKTFWEYLEPVIGKKSYKLIKKSININKYEQAIQQIK